MIYLSNYILYSGVKTKLHVFSNNLNSLPQILLKEIPRIPRWTRFWRAFVVNQCALSFLEECHNCSTWLRRMWMTTTLLGADVNLHLAVDGLFLNESKSEFFIQDHLLQRKVWNKKVVIWWDYKSFEIPTYLRRRRLPMRKQKTIYLC